MAAKKQKTKSVRASANGMNLLEGKVEQLQAIVAEIEESLAQIEATTSQFPQLTPAERSTSLGRLREGEATAITQLCDVMDTYPGHFVAMAAIDHGDDDTVIETAPTRANIARREALAPLVDRAQSIADRISDAVLVLGDRARQVSIPAYRIATTAAVTDRALRTKLSPVTTHYGAGARKAQATVKKKKKGSA